MCIYTYIYLFFFLRATGKNEKDILKVFLQTVILWYLAKQVLCQAAILASPRMHLDRGVYCGKYFINSEKNII